MNDRTSRGRNITFKKIITKTSRRNKRKEKFTEMKRMRGKSLLLSFKRIMSTRLRWDVLVVILVGTIRDELIARWSAVKKFCRFVFPRWVMGRWVNISVLAPGFVANRTRAHSPSPVTFTSQHMAANSISVNEHLEYFRASLLPLSVLPENQQEF